MRPAARRSGRASSCRLHEELPVSLHVAGLSPAFHAVDRRVDRHHVLFQLPFGVTGRYNWLTDSVFQPYAGLKLGANYAEMSSYYYIIKQYTDTWGFYLSPEIGVSIFPRPDYRLGFHVALYYSYSTNSGDVLTYSMDNINNFGIRVGISF